MKHVTKPAFIAGTASHVPNSGSSGFVGCGEIATQAWFPNIHRRDLMSAVNTCRRDLKLSPSVLVTLDALLSCLPVGPGKDGVVTPQVLLTVYASNETLCFRAKGITDRQLRRHLDALEQAGLLQRRDSANGKRFPIMRGGKVVGAFGLDLSPLFLRAADIIAAAQIKQHQSDELKGLRARIRHLCAQVVDLVQHEALNTYYNLARRANLTLLEANRIIRDLTALFHEPSPSGIKPEEAQVLEETTASAGHIVRHKKPESQTLKKEPSTQKQNVENWSDLTHVQEFFAEPSNPIEAKKIAYQFANMLGLSESTLSKALEKMSLLSAFMRMNDMAGRIDKIQSPNAYFLTGFEKTGIRGKHVDRIDKIRSVSSPDQAMML